MTFKINMLAFGLSLAMGSVAANASTSMPTVNHVLLISVDGLHANDLAWCTKNNACPTLAGLVKSGVAYSSAFTPFPSDSFPGLVGQLTGGNPKTTGVYYDDEYSRSLLPLGTTNCANATLGAEVYYAEVIEPLINGNISLDAGQGIPNLYPIVNTLVPGVLSSVPSSILKLAGSPNDVRNIEIDPTTLPVDPKTCQPVYPHQYLRVNTVFEVVKAHGLHTAWSDKHPAYEILNGPSGQGIDDLFAPEINSIIDPSSGDDWTKNNVNTQKYDTIKVAAVVNEINGKDHAGINSAGVPSVFGLNFQAVSTAQKLNTSFTPASPATSQLGGYNADGTPGPVLVSAIQFVDYSLSQLLNAINNNPVTQGNTAIIVSAKHGQSPVKRSDLTLINDGNNTTSAVGGGLTDFANAAWAAAYPSKVQPLIAHPMDDDGVLWWLNDRVDGPAFAQNFLLNYNSGATIAGQVVPQAIGSDANGNKVYKAFTSAGLDPTRIYAGTQVSNLIGVKASDDRYPDVVGIALTGSVYAGGKLSKIAEHGGNNFNDRNVPIVVSAPGVVKAASGLNTATVSTVQIAPTILKLLGINPAELQAVQTENTQVLPGLN